MSDGESPVDQLLLERVRARLSKAGTTPELSDVADAIRSESHQLLGVGDLLRTLRSLESELFGAGPLELLLADDTVTDVLVAHHGRVWADRGEGLAEQRHAQFADDGAVRQLAARLAAKIGRRLDEAQPWIDGVVDGFIPDRLLRVHAILPPVSRSGTCVSVRVLRRAKFDLAALVCGGAVSAEGASLLRRIVLARLAFLIIGGTGAGKTTLLSAMLSEVPSEQRVVCVEDVAELAPTHDHTISLTARTANIEGAGEVSLRDLVRQALRMNPDRIVVGEVRGVEIVDLLAALNTGHDGGGGTLHANTPQQVPARVEALSSGSGLSAAEIHSQFAAAIQVVIHSSRRRDGQRRIEAIAVVEPHGDQLRILDAWRAEGTAMPGAAKLQQLLATREGL